MKQLQAQADAMLSKQSSAVLEKIRELMSKHGLTTADIDAQTGGKKRGPKPGEKAAVKAGASTARYRDPKSGATWTGHGRAPGWIANAKDRTKFLIDATGATASKPKDSAKAPGKAAAKSKLPPKYRNPKTGETWSGHARPPAWIKDVKDRSKFLIAGAGEGAAEPKAVAAKKAVAPAKTAVKKVATKKAAAKKVVAKKGAVKKVATTAKKATTKKTAVKKAAAKKVGAKKVVARKAVASSAPPAQAPAQAADSAGATTIA